MPRNVEVQGKYQKYTASYEQKDGVVTVVREAEDHTPGPECAPSVSLDYKKFAVGVKKDLRAQLLYE